MRALLLSGLPALAAVLFVGASGAQAAAPADASPGPALARQALRAWRLGDADTLISAGEKSSRGADVWVLLRGRYHYLRGDYAVARRLLHAHFGSRRPAALGRVLAPIEAAWQLLKGYRRHRSKSGRFLLVYPPGREAILAPYAERALERAAVTLEQEFGWKSDRPVRVEILPGPDALAKLSPLTAAEIQRTGTIALSRDHRLMVVTPRALLTGYSWLDTLVHEYVHYLLELRAPHRVPLWLHEGLARFAQTRWREALPTKLTPLQGHLLAGALRARKFVPLDRMMPSFAKLKDQQEAALAYAQVAAMVLYVYRQKGSAGLRRLVDSLAAGKDTNGALRVAAGLSLAGLQVRYQADLRRRGLKEVAVYRYRGRQFKQAPRPRPRPGKATTPPRRTPFARYRRLGAILKARRRLGAAAREYGRALDATAGTDGRTANTLARLLLKLGRRAAAQKAVASALPYRPEMAALQVVAARIAQAQGRAADAERHLWRANGIDPFDPEIHCRLTTLLSARAAAAEAKREAAVCRRLGGTPTHQTAPLTHR